MLTDLQVSRIFHLYCGCSVVSYTNGSPFILELQGVRQGEVYIYNHWRYIRDYKLALKKLEDITDEDAIEATRIFDGTYFSDYPNPAQRGRYLIRNNVETLSYVVYQYLIQKGYAVPLFVEVGHPDNGKTAIELEVAVDIATLKPSDNG